MLEQPHTYTIATKGRLQNPTGHRMLHQHKADVLLPLEEEETHSHRKPSTHTWQTLAVVEGWTEMLKKTYSQGQDSFTGPA